MDSTTPANPQVLVTVHIVNDYEDRHHSEHDVQVPAPAATDEGALEDWWEEQVWPHTGDGHSGTLGSCYTASITAAADQALAGLTREWC